MRLSRRELQASPRSGNGLLVWFVMLGTLGTVVPLPAEPMIPPPGKAKPAKPRQVLSVRYEEREPLFSVTTSTLDPLAVARNGWNGYLRRMGGPWGMTADWIPMHRLYFQSHALPWASVQPNAIDGFDVNTRNVGAHAILHAMFGVDKRNDPIETGQLAYILSLTPEGEGSFIRHGELAENLLALHEQTQQRVHRDWAERVIRSLRPPVDSADPMGGWLHLHVGWNIGAFSKWYALTGEKPALDMAVACYDRVTKSRDSAGDDGAFRPDGSFGGQSQSTTASWHMHGHTHILTGMLVLGEQLLQEGNESKGLEVLAQVRNTFDWLYDPTRNPDAGSLTGWLGEWLMVGTGWDRTSDCEGCTMGDMVETACGLGAASRWHPSLSPQSAYYDQAEQFFRGQIVESIFELKPNYRALLRQCLERRVEKNALGAVTWRDQSSHQNHAQLAVGDVSRIHMDSIPSRPAALRMDGTGYFKLQDSAALRVPEFSIAAVVNIRGQTNQTIYSNYDNPVQWGKGVNLSVTANRQVNFFTADGSQANYDPLVSEKPLTDGLHLIVASYGSRGKQILVDGEIVAEGPSKGLDYGVGTVAAIGALREFEFWLQADLAELLVVPATTAADPSGMMRYLSDKYAIPLSGSFVPPGSAAKIGDPLVWFQAHEGYVRERPEATPQAKQAELERLYRESVATAERLQGRLLGLCGFNDWVNHLPAQLDPRLPGIDMMGCCSDAVIRAAGAIWRETVTGTVEETRVNMAFNRVSPLLDVVSSLPHRGEVNLLVKDSRRVLVRIPGWSPREKVKAFVDQKPIAVTWQDSYVVFDSVTSGQQLTVTYPLRIAEIQETVGSLEGTTFTEKWRGHTMVDISPPGRRIPMYLRPELDTDELPPGSESRESSVQE